MLIYYTYVYYMLKIQSEQGYEEHFKLIGSKIFANRAGERAQLSV